MKNALIIILIIFSQQLFSQNKSEDRFIQNFYTTCKAQKYTAFNLMNVGISRFDWGQYNRAINKFKKSLEKDSTLCDSWYLIGYSYQKLNEYENSIESCKKSIEMNQESYSAYIIMGYSNLYLNDTTEALRSFESGKIIFPKKVDSYYGISLIKYWQKDFKGAINEYSEFEKNTSEDVTKKDIETYKKLIDKIKLEK